MRRVEWQARTGIFLKALWQQLVHYIEKNVRPRPQMSALKL